MNKLNLLVGIVLMHSATFAQINPPSDTVKWKAESYTDVTLNESGPSSHEFITYGSSHVTWKPDTTTDEIVFTVDSIIGTWSSGSVTYAISRNGRHRQLTVENQNGSIKLTLSFTDALDQTRTVTYTIAETLKLNN